jgi:hypothetical protein
MGMSSRAGVLALAFSGFLLAGCQTTAQTSGEGGAAVQMARDAMARGDLVSTASSRQAQAIAPRIYLIRGLANVFSQGMDDLGAKLRQRGYNATVHEHGAWSVIAAEIVTNQRASGGRHQAVVVGHSLGANAVTDIANEVGRQGGTVALSVAFDPTVRQQLAGGTRRYVNLFQSNNGWGSALQHVELQRADHADDGCEPSMGRNSCTTPSSAICCSASRSFFAFIASFSLTRRRISGAKLGTPLKTMSSPSVSVSPMRSVPWFGMPTTSPARPPRRAERSCAKKNCGAERHRLAGAHQLRLHAARQLARADAHEGDAVAVVGVHVRLDLEDEAGHLRLLVASPCGSGAFWARGGGA